MNLPALNAIKYDSRVKRPRQPLQPRGWVLPYEGTDVHLYVQYVLPYFLSTVRTYAYSALKVSLTLCLLGCRQSSIVFICSTMAAEAKSTNDKPNGEHIYNGYLDTGRTDT